jgi:O-antigen/teichoic acid export membrane protein
VHSTSQNSVGDPSAFRRQLLTAGAGSIALRILYAFLGLALGVVLARAMRPDGYGLYTFALSTITLLAIPAQVGLPALLVREVAKYHLNSNWGLFRGILLRANQAVFAISGLIVVIAATALWLLGDRLTSEEVYTFNWSLVLLILIALGDVRAAVLRGLRKVVQGQLPEQALVPGFLLTLALAAGMFGSISAATAMASPSQTCIRNAAHV